MSHRIAATGLALTLVALAGCGHSAASSPATRDEIPLPSGVRVIQQARQCDRGANAFCDLELVVVDPRLRSSGDLVTLEGRVLERAGWSTVPGDFGDERGADSPDQKLQVSYGTSLADLIGSGAGYFKREPSVAMALSRQLLHHVPAIALTLSAGPA